MVMPLELACEVAKYCYEGDDDEDGTTIVIIASLSGRHEVDIANFCEPELNLKKVIRLRVFNTELEMSCLDTFDFVRYDPGGPVYGRVRESSMGGYAYMVRKNDELEIKVIEEIMDRV